MASHELTAAATTPTTSGGEIPSFTASGTLRSAAAAVTGTFVVNGSPSQTAMAEQAGASSQVAQVAFAGTVLLVLLFFTGPLQYLPHCALAAIVIGAVWISSILAKPAGKPPMLLAGLIAGALEGAPGIARVAMWRDGREAVEVAELRVRRIAHVAASCV